MDCWGAPGGVWAPGEGRDRVWLAQPREGWAAAPGAVRGRQPRSLGRLCGGEGTRGETMTAATLIRRIAARREIVFEALVTAEGIASWYGPADVPAISAASDPRVGGRFEAR